MNRPEWTGHETTIVIGGVRYFAADTPDKQFACLGCDLHNTTDCLRSPPCFSDARPDRRNIIWRKSAQPATPTPAKPTDLPAKALRGCEAHLSADLAQYAADGDLAVDEVRELLTVVREALSEITKE